MRQDLESKDNFYSEYQDITICKYEILGLFNMYVSIPKVILDSDNSTLDIKVTKEVICNQKTYESIQLK